MSGLVLKLAPSERVLINGAVIKNVERPSKITICTPETNILRLKDAIHPEEVNTPIARVCYMLQLILSGDIPTEHGKKQVAAQIEQLQIIFQDQKSTVSLLEAQREISEGRIYSGLKLVRGLLPLEAILLKRNTP